MAINMIMPILRHSTRAACNVTCSIIVRCRCNSSAEQRCSCVRSIAPNQIGDTLDDWIPHLSASPPAPSRSRPLGSTEHSLTRVPLSKAMQKARAGHCSTARRALYSSPSPLQREEDAAIEANRRSSEQVADEMDSLDLIECWLRAWRLDWAESACVCAAWIRNCRPAIVRALGTNRTSRLIVAVRIQLGRLWCCNPTRPRRPAARRTAMPESDASSPVFSTTIVKMMVTEQVCWSSSSGTQQHTV